ncbi:MAG: 16S rRNA (guanine(966)-N(2))-methyltransferase RsmD [Acidobacteriota bacterium]
MISSTGEMRVIGGIHRGRRLRTIGGLAVRPTSDRLRERLFNILAPRIQGSRFLDICAGSGAVGIEALSRGASEVTFIERSRRACAVIEANLASLGIAQATIINQNAAVSLKQLDQETTQFDIAFFDPPYASEIYTQVMNQLSSGNLLTAEALVIVEHRVKTPPGPDCGKLRIFREVKQGESALAFYEISPV